MRKNRSCIVAWETPVRKNHSRIVMGETTRRKDDSCTVVGETVVRKNDSRMMALETGMRKAYSCIVVAETPVRKDDSGISMKETPVRKNDSCIEEPEVAVPWKNPLTFVLEVAARFSLSGAWRAGWGFVQSDTAVFLRRNSGWTFPSPHPACCQDLFLSLNPHHSCTRPDSSRGFPLLLPF